MIRKIIYIIALTITSIQLICGGCKKEDYISKEEFCNNMKGEWYVLDFTKDLNQPPFGQVASISQWPDSLHYMFYNSYSINYSYDDSVICTLPEIENMQNWTITESNDDLLLETIDLCGIKKNYWIEYENYRYHTQYNGVNKNVIDADIRFVNSDTTISFSEFYLYLHMNPICMDLVIETSSSRSEYDVRRR